MPYLWTQEDPKTYNKFLQSLRHDNFLCILAAKGVDTNQTEKYYGTKYAFETLDDQAYRKLSAPRKIPGFHLPEPKSISS